VVLVTTEIVRAVRGRRRSRRIDDRLQLGGAAAVGGAPRGGYMKLARAFVGVCGLALFACGSPPVVIGDAGAGDDAGPAAASKPSVMLLADSSGSMGWRPSCTCTTSACTECSIDCSAAQHSRWHALLAAIGGSLQNFSCSARERTAEDGATYDIGYYNPFYVLGDDVTQASDGILDRYADKAGFGVATFDAMRTYVGAGDLVRAASFRGDSSDGAPGEFSYAGGSPSMYRMRPDGSSVGKVRYPTTAADYFIDSGIMSSDAPYGGLSMPSDATSQAANIRASLRGVRPFGGTPTASALDDLWLAYSSFMPAAGSKQYVLFFTDGAPDDDFRQYPVPGCNCAAEGTCPPNEDSSIMACPFPTPEDAAAHLHCGFDARQCNGPVTKLIIVALDVSDGNARSSLEAVAAAGGGQVLYADTEADLRAAASSAMDLIVADAAQ
jgi:hypothetical protein